MAWIPTVRPADATGLLKRLYDDGVRRAGRVFQILQVSSLLPEVVDGYIRLYGTLMMSPTGPLARSEREMIATIVSYENDCFY